MYDKVKAIITQVARDTGVTETEIKGSSRQKWVSAARQELMLRLREDLKLSYSEVAFFTRRLAVATVIHGIRAARKRREQGIV